MLSFRKIPFWETSRRIERLVAFGNAVVTYFTGIDSTWRAAPAVSPEAQRAREFINENLVEASDIVHAAGLATTVTITPPPITGGFVRSVDLFFHIFLFERDRISPEVLLDCIQRAIGIYKKDFERARRRTFNPFFWLGRVFDAVAGAPFALIRRAGFSSTKIEDSWLGRSVKLLIYLLTVAVTVLTLLERLGFLDDALVVLGIQPLGFPPVPP